ncbi:MAG TPA: hypothetical protein VF006_03445 [Longimicrobium sp.]
MPFVSKIRRAAPVLFAALALSLGACDPETPTRNDHPDIAAVRLTVGAQSVTVTASGTQTGTLTVPRGENAVSVTWLNSGGSAISFNVVVTMQIVPVGAGTGVSFVSAGTTGGLLTATSAGARTAKVSLFHGDHPDFEANVNFTVS